MDIKSKAVRGFAWTISQRVGTHAVSFLVFLTLSRFLGAEDFGLVSMATALVVFADNIIDLGFTQALIQREKIDKDHIDSAFWTVIILGCGLTLMGILGSSTIAVIYNEPRVAKVLAWISISIMFSALGKIQWGILQRSLAFDKLAIRTFISELIGGVVGIMMALQGYGVWSLVGRNLSRDFTGMLVIWKMSNWRPGFRFSIKHFKHLFPFGANIIGNRLMEYSNRYVDQLFIGSILGAAALGYYTVGLRLYQLMLSLFLQSVSSVSFPVFSRLQEDFERLKRSFYQVTKFACLISFPIFIGMALVTPNIILTFFGQKWVPSIPVMQLFSLLGIVEVINYLGSSLLVATGKVTWKLGLTSINALINAIAILITVHTGIIAVTTAQVLRGFLLLPLTILLLQKVLSIPVKQLLRHITPPIIGTIILAVTIIIIKSTLSRTLQAPAMLVIYLISAATTYVLVIAYAYPSTLVQLRELIELLPVNREIN